jgi:CRP-like cAMP-binding protein/HAMP domain-containing protein
MFKKLSLGLKFIVVLAIVFLSGILLSGVLLSSTAHRQAEQQVESRATMLMEMVNAVRTYTNEQVQPLFTDRVNSGSTFIRESIPSYAARQSFEYLRKQPGFKDYFYKDAAPNPTNMRDLANEFETGLVEEFRKNPDLQEKSGFQQVGGKNLFYVARPLAIKDQSCLQCHSTPALAPKSQIATYGSENGFGWQMNQIVAAQTVYITAEEVFQSYNRQLWLMMAVFAVIFAVVLLVINTLLNRMVIQPIVPMARLTHKITHDQYQADQTDQAEAIDLKKLDKVARRSDELGQLAGLFRQMTHVISDREQSMKQLVEKLSNETASAKKAMAAVTRSTNGMSSADLIRRSRRSRFQIEGKQHSMNALLLTVPPFQSFSQSELERLTQLGYQIEFASQEVICHENEPGNTFYIVLSGSVEVYVSTLQKSLRIQTAGSFFGELSLLLGIPRTATVRTLEPTTLFAINQQGFQTLLQENPGLAESVATQLSTYQAELEERKEILRNHGLLKDEKAFIQDPLMWIRDRINQIFGV